MSTQSGLHRAALALGLATLVALPVSGQSLSLDDNPALAGGFGNGAEDEFGLAAAVLAPSPSLGLLPFPSDGTIFSPAITGALALAPNGQYIDAISTNHAVVPKEPFITIDFSVDRITTGIPGSAVAAEFGFGQQPGDIYTTTRRFTHPSSFVGTLGLGPFAGTLPSAGGGGSNKLTFDESVFGLTTAAGIVPAGVPAGPIGLGTHDNVDGFDKMLLVPVPGGPPGAGVYPVHSYFAIAPDEAAVVGGSAADIFDVAASTAGTIPIPYASAISMGLDTAGPNTDSVDALVLWDNGPIGGPATGGPGADPAWDYALFSLAPGSATLAALGLSPGDVLFTDFTGVFAVFAFDSDLGLFADNSGGAPFQNRSNIDALEINEIVPEPASFALAMAGLFAGWGLARRRLG